MKMRRTKFYIYGFLALCLCLGTSSCVKEVDDVFDKSANERIREGIEKDTEILKSASNGWVAEYFASPSSQYGGYNLLLKFLPGDSVQASSEVNNTVCYSHYKVVQSGGVILSFDDYNPVIHYFSDPVNPMYGADGTGFGGDLEFRVLSASADSVILIGKKHKARVRMTPLAAGTDWSEYLAKINRQHELMLFSNYKLAIGGDTIDAYQSYHSFIVTRFEEPDSGSNEPKEVRERIPYIMTPQGMKLYSPYIYKDSRLTGFQFDSTKVNYPDFVDKSIVLMPVALPLIEQLTSTYWSAAYSEIGDYAKPYWDAVKDILDNEPGKPKMSYLVFGKYGSDIGMTFNIGGYEGRLYYSVTAAGGATDKVVLAYKGKAGASTLPTE